MKYFGGGHNLILTNNGRKKNPKKQRNSRNEGNFLSGGGRISLIWLLYFLLFLTKRGNMFMAKHQVVKEGIK